MSWKETCVMDERLKMITDHLSGDYGATALSRKYGVSRKTIYKWIERYETGGAEGLVNRSRARHEQSHAISEDVEQKILELKGRWPLWGAPKILVKLREEVGEDACPCESTVSNVLKRHGLTRKARKRRRAVPSESPLGHCNRSNEVWCADFKGWFRTGDGSKCTPLTVTDGHSRYLLRCQGLSGQTGSEVVQPHFEAMFREYGMPEAIRTDNGPPFACAGLGGLTFLSVWWVRLGIRLERITPGKPQENGRHERMHRTLKDATANPPRTTMRKQQQAFDEFCREYNTERPHEALGQNPPGSLYEPSILDYPERLPEQQGYPEEWQSRCVRKGGQMKWNGKDVRLTGALWGQRVGLKPIEDGIWIVYFENLELGRFDERQMRVIPARRLKKSATTFKPQENV